MRYFFAALIVCAGLLSSSYGRDFNASGTDYRYSFSDIDGWMGIGRDLKTFPQADMVFFAVQRNGETVTIRYPYTDVYIFTNATSGTPEEFSKLEAHYKERSQNLKVVHAKDIKMSETLGAKVTYFMNFSSDNKSPSHCFDIQGEGFCVARHAGKIGTTADGESSRL